jgi:hypothetical protein
VGDNQDALCKEEQRTIKQVCAIENAAARLWIGFAMAPDAENIEAREAHRKPEMTDQEYRRWAIETPRHITHR